MRPSVLLFVSALTLNTHAAPENWPGWRGPRGDGSSTSTTLPLEWSVPENVAWKTPIPGAGHSSPIIWENHLFLTSATAKDTARHLFAIDRTSGKILWDQTVLTSPHERIHHLNSYASSTPVTDGTRVYSTFLDGKDMFIAAYDFSGKKLWEARPGTFSSMHGYCSSPVLWNGKLIVNGDHDGDGYLVALDITTGKTIWKTPRPNNTRSYTPPLLRTIGGRNQLILSGSKCVASYDPDSGAQHWIIDGPTEQYVASLVYNEEENLLFLTSGFPEHHILAIDPGGSGNVTDTHVAWRTTKHTSYVPSPLSIGKHFLVVSDGGIASCYTAKTGDRLWYERLPARHSASPVHANGDHAFFLSDQGVMTVLRPGAEFKILAQNKLGEKTNASPAIYGNTLYLRGHKHLYAIARRP